MRKLLALGAVSILAAGTTVAGILFTVGEPQPLGAVAGVDDSYGTGVNSRGTVAGYGITTDPFTFATVYTPLRSTGGSVPEPLSYPAGWRFVVANDVSDNDVVVGYGAKPGPCSGCSQYSAVMWDASGQFIALGPYYDEANQYTASSAQAISPSGRFIAGHAVFSDNVGHATRWDGGVPEALPSPCEACDSRTATGVNDAGDVVGSARDASGADLPVLWRNGTARFLPMPAGLVPTAFSTTGRMRITNSGEAYGSVSFMDDEGTQTWYAIRWDANGTPSVISTMPSSEDNLAAVGTSGLVALRACDATCHYRLYLDGSYSSIWDGGRAFYQVASSSTSAGTSSQAYLAGWYWNGTHDQMSRTMVTMTSADDPPPPPPPNKAPVATLPTLVTGAEGAFVRVFGTVTDEDGPGPLMYEWDLDGNGTFETRTPASDIELFPRDNDTVVVALRAKDGAGATSEPAYTTVAIHNVAPSVQAGSDITTNGGQSVRLDAHFSDAGADANWQYSVNWGDGTPASTGFMSSSDVAIAPSHNYTETGSFEVTISVTDKDGAVGSGTLTVTVLNRAPIAKAGGPYTGTEGSAVAFDGSLSSDPDGDAITYAWDFGDGATGTGATVSHVYADSRTYTAKLTITDSHNASTSATVQVTIANVAPELGEISGIPEEPIMIGTPVTLIASFTDPARADGHIGSVQWDGALAFTTSGVMTVSPSTMQPGLVRATGTLASGVYTVSLRVQDKDGGAGVSSTAPDYIVVYDPSAGFVTGGGWILSTTGACRLTTACGGAQGKATFGFVSKYLKGATVPSGNTEFTFQAGNLRFSATEYEWLIVNGWKAQYKGAGRINGGGDYGFMLTAFDGDQDSNGKSADRFRIKIWDRATGAIVYDNQMNQSDNSSAATALGGGSIQIHSK